MPRPDYPPRRGAQDAGTFGARLRGERARGVVGHHVRDAVVRLPPGAPAVEAVVAAVALTDEGALYGVPVPNAAVPLSLALVEVPIRVRPDDRAALPREPGHAHEPVHHDPRADAPLPVGFEKVAAVVEVPPAVVVTKRVGVYGKRVVRRENRTAVLERSGWLGGRGNAQLVVLPLLSARRVVHVESAVVVGDLGRPERLEGVAGQG